MKMVMERWGFLFSVVSSPMVYFFKDNVCCLSEYQSNNALHARLTSTMQRAIAASRLTNHTRGTFQRKTDLASAS